MTALFPLLLAICQFILGFETQGPTEPVVEHHSNGIWVGAISNSSEISTGFWFPKHGAIVFENRAP